MIEFEKGKLLYENPLAGPADVAGFRAEGDVAVTFPRGRMRLENAHERDEAGCRHGNFVFWCPQDFPDNISVAWDFRPLTDAGLAMFWLAARGRNGEDLFDPRLAPRDGKYEQYHHGDIDALHISYFRRTPEGTGFRTCNLRKSFGFHLACRSGDPLPEVRCAAPSYRLEVIKSNSRLVFSINDLQIFHWVDDGRNFGPVLKSGKIGFRQMAGLIAEYACLRVREVVPRQVPDPG